MMSGNLLLKLKLKIINALSGMDELMKLFANKSVSPDPRYALISSIRVDCISLLQSVLNSPHAYSQNKAFTKHIVDALMQSYEEKLELEVSI